MEQDNSIANPVKRVSKKHGSSAIYFDRDFMKKILRLTEKTNKKSFGRKVKSKDTLEKLLQLVDVRISVKWAKKTPSLTIAYSA